MAVFNTDIPGLKLFKKGKVRDVYEVGKNLLIVATDRLSAFDVVMPTPIPDKGKILTTLSAFWFKLTEEIIKNHVIATSFSEVIPACPPRRAGRSIEKELEKHKELLEGRSMLVKRTQPLPIECVVRGYLAGSGWKEYKEKGTICGVKLPDGLKESDSLPEAIFTPATKATSGHDENIQEEEAKRIVGDEVFATVKEKSLAIYQMASEYAKSRGIIISDTKFEFGRARPAYGGGDGEIILIDEVLTPDSSRFWPLEEYAPGRSQRSFDKQFVRDYLEGLDWDKKPPGPELPEDVVEKTSQKYREALRRITGEKTL